MEAPIEEIGHDDSDVQNEKVEDDGTEFKEYTDGIKDEETVEEEGNKQSTQVEVEDKTPKAFTWASLAAKKNTPVSAAAAPTPTQAVAPKQTAKKPEPPQQQRAPAKKREEAPSRKETSEEPRRKAPDSHQIFIGNLHNNITEKDVRDAFKEFGNIVEVRLNPKNFGFVAFDGPDPPKEILGSRRTKSIVILGNTINTEVKRSVSGSGRGGVGSGGGGRDRERDNSARGRNEMNKNVNRSNSGGQNRTGKSSSYSQKQPRSSEDTKNKDTKPPREQRQTRR